MAKQIKHMVKSGKKSVYKLWSFILGGVLWVIGLLSAGSCSDPWGNMIVCEYGCPHADYKISGVVQDADTGAGIPGISIRLISIDSYRIVDTTSDIDGNYQYIFSSECGYYMDFTLIAVDTDGAANGAYSDTTTDIHLSENDYSAREGWDYGDVDITQDILLTEKSGENNE